MRVVSTLLSIPLMIGLAVPAHAGPSGDDAVFLASLERAGITYSHPDRHSIGQGRMRVSRKRRIGSSGRQRAADPQSRVFDGRLLQVRCDLRACLLPHQITKTSVSAK